MDMVCKACEEYKHARKSNHGPVDSQLFWNSLRSEDNIPSGKSIPNRNFLKYWKACKKWVTAHHNTDVMAATAQTNAISIMDNLTDQDPLSKLVSMHSSRSILRQFLHILKVHLIAPEKRTKLVSMLKRLYKNDGKGDHIWQLGQMLRMTHSPNDIIKFGGHEIVDWYDKYHGQPSVKGDMEAARKYLQENRKK